MSARQFCLGFFLILLFSLSLLMLIQQCVICYIINNNKIEPKHMFTCAFTGKIIYLFNIILFILSNLSYVL